MSRKVQHATNCFLVKGDKVLLGMKKRGLGVGWWNGFGGKINNSESVERAAVRETNEEIGVEILKFGKVAELYFYLVDKKKTRDLMVHVF